MIRSPSDSDETPKDIKDVIDWVFSPMVGNLILMVISGTSGMEMIR